MRRQVVLPWGQVIKISFNSIKVRLFRSLVTTMTLALAIAFVSYTWSGYEILNAMWPNIEQFEGTFGTSAKDRWLVILSLLVCVVGIVNAQLMAVTERFREIGTFKCLGALDSFVVRIFVVEAIYQGLFGGFAGSLLGLVVSTLTLALKFGWPVFIHSPLAGMLLTLVGATLLAVFLSLTGVIYPALVAARMEPAVALRTEQ